MQSFRSCRVVVQTSQTRYWLTDAACCKSGKDGRDHWPGCFTSILAGGGIVYGKSDRHATFPAADPVTPRDLIATVYHALGVPAGQTLNDTSGRPHFVRPGNAIRELLV